MNVELWHNLKKKLIPPLVEMDNILFSIVKKKLSVAESNLKTALTGFGELKKSIEQLIIEQNRRDLLENSEKIFIGLKSEVARLIVELSSIPVKGQGNNLLAVIKDIENVNDEKVIKVLTIDDQKEILILSSFIAKLKSIRESCLSTARSANGVFSHIRNLRKRSEEQTKVEASIKKINESLATSINSLDELYNKLEDTKKKLKVMFDDLIAKLKETKG